MDLEQTIVGVLKANAGVVALIGARLFPNYAQQGTPSPYTVYSQEGGNAVMTMSGPTSLSNYRLHLEACADTYAAAKAAQEALSTCLNGLKGQLAGLLKVAGAFVQDGGDSYDPPMHDDDVGVHSCSVDLLLWYYTS